MGNVYLVYLLQSLIHSVFSVFAGWRVEYTASVYFVYLFQGQIHSVFGVFASVHVCISHLGSHLILLIWHLNYLMLCGLIIRELFEQLHQKSFLLRIVFLVFLIRD